MKEQTLKISIIVITYNRQKELAETIENIRLEESEYEELILVDNCSIDGTQEYGERLSKECDKIQYFRLAENLGVAGGRNYAIRKAKGDILVFLDDDAVWGQENSLSMIRNKFESDTKIGILAFKIVNFHTGNIRSEEFPFTNKKLSPDKERLTSAYIGAGHAIRRDVFERCGLYPEDFFYGGEELDLSFRVINQQYNILFYPKVEVLHKQVLKGRMKNDEKWIRVYRNRLIMGYKYLRWYHRIVSDILWFGKMAVKTRTIRCPWESVSQYRREKDKLKKEKVKLNDLTVKYMKHNYGRLWY